MTTLEKQLAEALRPYVSDDDCCGRKDDMATDARTALAAFDQQEHREREVAAQTNYEMPEDDDD